MKTLKTMTNDERSLLLFLEARAVDHGGKVDGRHMNKDDFEISERWDAEGFINFGRVAFENCNQYGAHWCKLSEEAHQLAAEERRARCERLWKKRVWRTTEEKRKAA